MSSLIKIRLRGWCSGKESPANAGATGVRSLDWEDPLEWEMGTCSSILAWKTPARGAWQATVHVVAKNQTRLSNLSTAKTSLKYI